MPIDNKKTSGGTTIYFEEQSHKYTDNFGRTYVSITQFIHQFLPKFEAETIAFRIAQRDGVSLESILDDWEQKRVSAAKFGTKIHRFMELYAQGKEHLWPQEYKGKQDEKTIDYIMRGRKIIDAMKKTTEIYATEEIVFLPELQLAGTIDLILKKGDRYILVDWKTNSKPILDGGSFNKGFGALEGISDSLLNIYSIQLGLYRYIFARMMNISVDKVSTYIVHLTEEGVKKIKTLDMSDTVEKLIKHRKEQLCTMAQ